MKVVVFHIKRVHAYGSFIYESTMYNGEYNLLLFSKLGIYEVLQNFTFSPYC